MVESDAVLIQRRALSENVFELTFACEAFETPCAGQFLNVSVEGFPLKRPFGIVEFDEQKKTVTFAFRVAGKGTDKMKDWAVGHRTAITFPLGNGFWFEGVSRAAIVGGGVGVFPLLSLFRQYPDVKFDTFLGYANAENAFYLDEFKSRSASVSVATDDGSFGRKGFVTELLTEKLDTIKPELVLACGPCGMFVSLKKALGGKIRCLASAEERMGCGVGACLVCACRTTENGELRKKRVCKDGPVFELETMEL